MRPILSFEIDEIIKTIQLSLELSHGCGEVGNVGLQSSNSIVGGSSNKTTPCINFSSNGAITFPGFLPTFSILRPCEVGAL